MSVLRIVGVLVAILALYAVITEPVGSAASVRDTASGLGSVARAAGERIMQFGTALTR